MTYEIQTIRSEFTPDEVCEGCTFAIDGDLVSTARFDTLAAAQAALDEYSTDVRAFGTAAGTRYEVTESWIIPLDEDDEPDFVAGPVAYSQPVKDFFRPQYFEDGRHLLSTGSGWQLSEPNEQAQEIEEAADLTDKQFNILWAAALETPDRAAFVSDWTLSSLWEETEQAVSLELVGLLWDIEHMSVKELRAASGLNQAEFATRFCMPKRTVENWDYGDCSPYIRLMLAQLLGLLRR